MADDPLHLPSSDDLHSAMDQPADSGEPKHKAAKPDSPFARNRRSSQLNRIGIAVAAVAVLLGIVGYYFLSSGKGRILVLDTSPDLKIELNGNAAQLTPDARSKALSVYPGQYRLRLTRPNYLPLSLDIKVGRSQTVEVRPAYTLLPNTRESAVSTIDFVRPSPDQRALLYLGNNRSTIYRFEIATGSQIPLTDKPLEGVNDIQWSSEPTVALISQQDGVYLHEIPKFDFRNQILLRLGGSEIISPIWDPNDTGRIALAYHTAAGEYSLVFADKRATSLSRKADLSALPPVRLVWSPDSRYLALIGTAADQTQNDIWMFLPADGSLNRITVGGMVRDASFSPDSSTLLYETASSDPANVFGATLTASKPDGSGKVPLGIAGKIAQAAWHDSTSFFLPNPSRNSLTLYTLSGEHTDIAYSLPDASVDVRGMYYFPKSRDLLFYTKQSIYTVNLSL